MARKVILSVDIGGTNLKGGLVDHLTGELIFSHQKPTEANLGIMGVAENICFLFSFLSEYARRNGYKVIAVAYDTPGNVDPGTGMVSGSCSNIPGLIDFDLPKLIRGRLGLPVFDLNDAKSFTLAEATYGAGKGLTDFGVWTLGTGVGGGLVLNGEIFYGKYSSACELGHLEIDPLGPLCKQGHRGCIESFCGTEAIKRFWRRSYDLREKKTSYHDKENPSVKEIFKHAEQGDELCLLVVDEVAERLAKGMATTAKMLDLQAGILGGKISSEDFFLAKVQKFITPQLYETQQNFCVLRAKYHDEGGIIGAAAYAYQRLLELGKG
jgi:glucokinase